MGDLTCFSTVRNVCYVEGVNVCLWASIRVFSFVSVCVSVMVDHDVFCVLVQHTWRDLAISIWALIHEARCRV